MEQHMSDYTFFWDGPLSQWDPATFEIDGVEYQVIHGEIYVPDTKRLDALCEQFQNILRYSYNRCKKGDISGSTRTLVNQIIDYAHVLRKLLAGGHSVAGVTMDAVAAVAKRRLTTHS